MIAENILEISNSPSNNVLPTVLRERGFSCLVKEALQNVLPALAVTIPTGELSVIQDDELSILFSIVPIKVWLQPGDEVFALIVF